MKKILKYFGIMVFSMTLVICLISTISVNNNGKAVKLNNLFSFTSAYAVAGEDICETASCHEYRCSGGTIGCALAGELPNSCSKKSTCSY